MDETANLIDKALQVEAARLVDVLRLSIAQDPLRDELPPQLAYAARLSALAFLFVEETAGGAVGKVDRDMKLDQAVKIIRKLAYDKKSKPA